MEFGERGFALGRDRLEGIMRLLGEGLIGIGDLENAEFGGGPVPKQSTRHRNMRSMVALDRDGRGIDCAVFHREVVKAGKLDFVRLVSRPVAKSAPISRQNSLRPSLKMVSLRLCSSWRAAASPRRPRPIPTGQRSGHWQDALPR